MMAFLPEYYLISVIIFLMMAQKWKKLVEGN